MTDFDSAIAYFPTSATFTLDDLNRVPVVDLDHQRFLGRVRLYMKAGYPFVGAVMQAIALPERGGDR